MTIITSLEVETRRATASPVDPDTKVNELYMSAAKSHAFQRTTSASCKECTEKRMRTRDKRKGWLSAV